MADMVFKKLLSSLGFGGVEVDTVPSATPPVPGGPLTGQVHLRAKSDVEIAGIELLLVAGVRTGEVELARYPVGGAGLRLASGATQAVPFQVAFPAWAPFNILYGGQLPGYTLGVRTQVAVAGGSAKTDFDPLRVEADPARQKVIDALGVIGCRYIRNELRQGSPPVQAITFWAPLAPDQAPGPHVPQLTFVFAGDDGGLTVAAEHAHAPGRGEVHYVSHADAQRMSADPAGLESWVVEVDSWVTSLLSKPAPAAQGSFMQPTAMQQHGRGQQYAYGGRPHSYNYGGYRRGSGMGLGGAVAAGVGGAALGFLGGMMIGGMISDAMTPDMAGDQMGDAAGDMGGDMGGAEAGGYEDYGSDFGGDMGGGDWGGGEF